jgi:hypothetical protein
MEDWPLFHGGAAEGFCRTFDTLLEDHEEWE